MAAQTEASPIPVFPLVGSIITLSLCNLPCFSAASIIDKAILSFKDPVGLKNSTFAKRVTLSLNFFSMWFSLIKGLLPIISLAFWYIIIKIIIFN